MEASDAVIQSTAEDALLAKQATVQAGYYNDPYITSMKLHQIIGRRHVQPIIKRGTFARVCCIDSAVNNFIKLSENVNKSTMDNFNSNVDTIQAQVVVLGAGKDTSFFRLSHNGIAWYEIDHFKVIKEKAETIQNAKDTFNATVTTMDDDLSLSITTVQRQDQTCYLIAHDLREDNSILLQKLINASFDPNLLTLVVSECVLMYLPESSCTNLLHYLASNIKQCCICCYEPILGDNTIDNSFGRMMQTNLSKAGMVNEESCLIQTRTLEQHLQKLLDAGWHKATGCDMLVAYNSILTVQQRQKANQTEFLDELEEWMLIMRHYCFFVASVGTHQVGEIFCATGPNSILGFPEQSSTSLSTSI